MTTESDTPSGEPGPLNVDTAASAFAELLEPTVAEDPPVDTEIDPPKKKEEAPEESEADEGGDAPITVEVDGKQITLTKAEVAEAYKSGLRQSDYTQKTMAAAEEKKAAQAETQKAQQERYTYATNLQKMAAQLEGAIQQQANIDWNALLEADPVEFLKQKHLSDQRQAALQQNSAEQARIQGQISAERVEAVRGHLMTQKQELLAKLPEWKDEAKATSERDAIKSFLKDQGYDDEAVAEISDHRAVILARKAMLYDQMLGKARAAAKKVQNAPTKVERPGTSSDRNANLDGRTAAMRNHSKSGSVESAAAVFATLI